MNTVFRKFIPDDRDTFAVMVKKFYAPPAVLHFPPESVMMSCFDEACKDNGFVLGYMFETEGKKSGYAIISLKFETEVGGIAAWVEELFVEEKFRSQGIGKEFFAYLQNELSGKIKRLRLEVGDENDGAIRLYQKLGFEFLDYRQMVIDKDF